MNNTNPIKASTPEQELAALLQQNPARTGDIYAIIKAVSAQQIKRSIEANYRLGLKAA